MNNMKKYIKIILVVILAVIFARAMSVMVGGSNSDEPASDNRVAVIDFDGEIYGSQSFIEQLEKLKKDNTVKGIIIRVNSPGGAVAPSNAIYDYIVSIDKPVYVAMGSVAASGGYLVSLGADKIYAMPSTITGSIGVIMTLMNTEVLMDKIGVKSVILKSGKFKDAGNPDRQMTEEERSVLMAVVTDLYNQFINTVASRRNMKLEEVKKIADGRIFTGKMAKDLKLIDNLGSWREAYQDMKTMLNINDLVYYEVKKPKEWWETILNKIEIFENKLYSKGSLYYLTEIY